MTTQDFISTYRNFSDQQLLEVHFHIHDYSEEAANALAIVMQERGGLELIRQREQARLSIVQEKARIKKEILQLNSEQADIDFLTRMTTSNILSEEETRQVILDTFDEIHADIEDRKVKPRTLIGGGIAAGIAAVAGGILWGLQMVWSGRIFVLLLAGLVLFCYGLIYIVTRQSYKNKAVLLLTAMAVAVALGIGQLLFYIMGKQ